MASNLQLQRNRRTRLIPQKVTSVTDDPLVSSAHPLETDDDPLNLLPEVQQYKIVPPKHSIAAQLSSAPGNFMTLKLTKKQKKSGQQQNLNKVTPSPKVIEMAVDSSSTPNNSTRYPMGAEANFGHFRYTPNKRLPGHQSAERSQVTQEGSLGRHLPSTQPANRESSLPYVGQITLDQFKPRRGRKPNKTDICHLITKSGYQLDSRVSTANCEAQEIEQPLASVHQPVIRWIDESNSLRNQRIAKGPPPLRPLLEPGVKNEAEVDGFDTTASSFEMTSANTENDHSQEATLPIFDSNVQITNFPECSFEILQQKIMSSDAPMLLQALSVVGDNSPAAVPKKRDVPRDYAEDQKKFMRTLKFSKCAASGTVPKRKSGDVSICKFKFTGGPRPTLERKKTMSVNAMGKIRACSIGVAANHDAHALEKSLVATNTFYKVNRQEAEVIIEQKDPPLEDEIPEVQEGTGADNHQLIAEFEALVCRNANLQHETPEEADIGVQGSLRAQLDESSLQAVETSNSETNGAEASTQSAETSTSRRIETRSRTGAINTRHVNYRQPILVDGPEQPRHSHRSRISNLSSLNSCTNPITGRRPGLRRKMEEKFKDKGLLIQTQKYDAPQGATFCKFRQLKKFTRYLFRNWRDHLPDDPAAHGPEEQRQS